MTSRFHQILSFVLLLPAAMVPAQTASRAPHRGQQVPPPPNLPGENLEPAPGTRRGPRSATPGVSPDFIVLGYVQAEDNVYHYRWNALTHVASTFNSFSSSGALDTTPWVNRAADLKAGGGAQAAGTKVLLTCLNSGFDVSVINAVMTSSTARARLISDVTTAVTTDSYCGGVTFDFEPFSWSSGARDGMVTFFRDLRTSLGPGYEISIYGDALPSTTQWDIPGLEPSIDYIVYSAYDWATGTTAHAITDFDNTASQTALLWYLEKGLPASKLVYAFSTYGGRWSGVTAYDQSGSSRTAVGFTDGLFDTTVNPTNAGPQQENYKTGDEVGWYTYNSSGTNYVVTWDSPEAIAYKVGNVLSTQDRTATPHWSGRRLRGVAFWSLMWLSETTSWDMRSGTTVARTRTYPHAFQIMQETLAPPGRNTFVIEGWEGLDYRWRDPNEAPDTHGDSAGRSSRLLVPAPPGAPQPSTNAMQVTFDFQGASENQAVFAHEVLSSPVATTLRDTNAVAAVLSRNMALDVQVYTPAAYAGRQVRMLVIDASHEIEASDPLTLDTPGWRALHWDLAEPAQAHPFTTAEPGLVSGDGVVDTAGANKRDLGFFGFLIEGGVAGVGTVTFDEMTYSLNSPGSAHYTINEFRYAGSSGEFVEIHGPAGPLPANLQLRTYNATNGAVASSFNLAGTIPDDTGDGHGLFVVGDPSVGNVDFSTGFSDSVDNLGNTDPGSLQLIDPIQGTVHDSLVYKAFGGLDDLIRTSTNGVANEGYPWLGEIATGGGPLGAYSKGRYPDGRDTDINPQDFSVQPPSPGLANGNSLPAGTDTFNFSTIPNSCYQTYQNFTSAVSAVGASPSGGNVYRCVDTSGGGSMGFIGDKALGADGNGMRVTGEIFIPSSGTLPHALGIGLCGTDGSNFFTASPAPTGYENGYWLIYENAAGVGLNDGQADHPGQFQFVHATNDNMDGSITTLLGQLARGGTGAAEGAWTTFELVLEPAAASDEQLVARINNTTIYSGPIPPGGPIQGAFQVGFRENHTGAPGTVEGTWIDGVTIIHGGAEAGREQWLLR